MFSAVVFLVMVIVLVAALAARRSDRHQQAILSDADSTRRVWCSQRMAGAQTWTDTNAVLALRTPDGGYCVDFTR